MEKEEILEQLEILKDSEIIIVEGVKDKKALGSFGEYNVIILNKPIYVLCEEISKRYKRAVILTDLDNEGKRLYSKIRENLERNGVMVDNKFRDFLFRETQLRNIEGMKSYVDH